MKKQQVLLALVLFALGTIGIVSILTMEIALPAEVEAILKEKFTSGQIKLLTLINPMMLLVVAIFTGTGLFQKVKLKVPIIEKLVGGKNDFNTSDILLNGILGGVLSGILLSLVSLIFMPILPGEFWELKEEIQPNLAVRFLYGGLTEEILMRFGLMTFIVWIFSRIFKKLTSGVYWIAIVLAAIIFAFGHFPIVYQSVETPSLGLLSYLLIGNTIGGIIFGWLYWRKGLESAFIAHMFAHLIMVMTESLLV